MGGAPPPAAGCGDCSIRGGGGRGGRVSRSCTGAAGCGNSGVALVSFWSTPRGAGRARRCGSVGPVGEGETAGRLGSGLSTARGRGLPPGWVQPCTCAGSRARRNKNHNCPPAPSLRVGRRRRRCALWHSRAARWPTGASADACPVGHARAAEPLLGGRCGTLRGHRLWRQRRPRWQPCQPCPPRWQFQQGVRSAMMCHGTAHPPRHSHTLPDSKPWS